MTVCGKEMAASESRLVLLSRNKSDFRHIDVKPRKIKIADDENAEEVRAFRDSLHAPQIPDTLLKYQYAAFQTAFTVLP